MKKKVIIIVISCFLFILGLLIYSRFIEPSLLKRYEYGVKKNTLPNSFVGVKIIHFSDLYYEYDRNYIEKLKNKINEYNADIIIFTGDLLNKQDYNTEQTLYLIDFLKQINSTLGKFAVLGESDSELSHQILTDANFKILNNEKTSVHNKSQDYINIIGINNSDYVFEEKEAFTITISHSPNNVNISNEYGDLFLFGHNHHKQINLPFFDSFINKVDKNKYDQEHFILNNSEIFISNGIGTKTIKYRLFNSPSFNVYRLYK